MAIWIKSTDHTVLIYLLFEMFRIDITRKLLTGNELITHVYNMQINQIINPIESLLIKQNISLPCADIWN